ncbi:MAG: dephospho-CoA kinase [Theionarchaea archaeon]|nr:dephospho-CoA kinase [Theionarchaea archaeon]
MYLNPRQYKRVMKVALTGTPGTGKTTIAKEIAQRCGMTHIDVSKMAREVNAVIAQEKETLVVDQDIIGEKIRDMDNIIIDSHFAHVFEVDLVFVLRCEPSILFERLKRRNYSEEKIRENVMAEILDFCVLDALEYHAPEKIFEIHEDPVRQILKILDDPVEERSLVHGSRTHFLTEENLALVT